MQAFWAKALRFTLDRLGRPASFSHMLEREHSLRYELVDQPRSIAASEVVRWQDWGKPSHTNGMSRAAGELFGWKAEGSEYRSYRHCIQALANIGSTETLEHWKCEIQDVAGLSASKSELRDFSSLDEMAESRARYLLDDITLENLKTSLDWQEIRIFHRESTCDHLAIHQWDGRLFLMNSGGSHHFAAGRYLAVRLGVEVPLHATLRIHRLSRTAVMELLEEYEVFALADEPEAYMMFMDAMRGFRAGFLWCALPRPYEHGRAVLLPRKDTRSMQIATLLHQTGHADLGAHLLDISARDMNIPGARATAADARRHSVATF